MSMLKPGTSRKKVLTAAVVAVLLLAAAVTVRFFWPKPSAGRPTGSGTGISVLFIGNSYTAVNDLPKTLADIAASLGDRVDYDAVTPGGYTLQQHSQDQTTLAKLRSKSWNFVVLQEQSQLPAGPDDSVNLYVKPAAAGLNRLIHEADPAAQAVFYETWGRKDGDKTTCPTNPETCSFDGMQARLTRAYEDLAAANSAALAPVGEAWATARQEHPEIELYNADGSHPSPAGTYLAACVFYVTLFHRSPASADALGLPPAQAAQLQDIALRTVLAEFKRVKTE
jgi:hypothetical protein